MAIREVLITAGIQLLFKILERIWTVQNEETDGVLKHAIVKAFIKSTPFQVKDTDGFIDDVVDLFKKHEIFIKVPVGKGE